MIHISWLTVKERLYNKTFYIITFIGLIVTFFLLISDNMTFNGKTLEGFNQRAEIIVVICNFFACLFAILLSSNTIPKERETKHGHLILVRNIKKWEYALALTLGNIIISVLCFFLLSSSLYIGAFILEGSSSILPIFKSQIILAVNVMVLSTLVSFYSIYIPSAVSAFFGIITYFIGVFYEMLLLFIKSLEGIWSQILKLLLYLMPNISSLQKQAGIVIGGGNLDLHTLSSMLFYGYLTIVLIILLSRREV